MANYFANSITRVIAVFTLGILITFSSCKKDDPEADVSTPAITDGSWIMTSNLITTPVGTFDEYADMDDCEKDDAISFSKDGKWVEEEGVTKCNSTDPQSTTGSYTLNDKILTVFSPQDTVVLTIKALTSSQLVVEFADFNSTLQIEISAVVTYKH